MTDGIRATVEYRQMTLRCPRCYHPLWRRADLVKRVAVVECARGDHSIGWASFLEHFPGDFREIATKSLGMPIYTTENVRTTPELAETLLFWSQVNRDGPTMPHRHDIGNCWTWDGRKNPGGYGVIKGGGFAHRRSWELAWGGKIPKGAVICHRCDNPPCVRPSHLLLGDNAINNMDMVQKGRNVGGPNQPSKMSRRVASPAAHVG